MNTRLLAWARSKLPIQQQPITCPYWKDGRCLAKAEYYPCNDQSIRDTCHNYLRAQTDLIENKEAQEKARQWATGVNLPSSRGKNEGRFPRWG